MKKIILDTKTSPVGDDVLVFDIETDSLDIATAKMKWFGAYSFKTNKYYMYTGEHLEEIQFLIDEHKIVVGYNSSDFDIPICENNGLVFDYKVQIDLLRVLFNPEMRKSVRENIIKVNGKILKSILKNHKLKTVAETFGLSTEKGDIDYKIFQYDEPDELSESSIKEILKYLHADLKITRELFEYLYLEFLPMKALMSEEQQRKYGWFKRSPASYAYSVICHHAGIKEEFSNSGEKVAYKGGYVMQPKKEISKNVLLFDFSSLYPSLICMANIFSHKCDCCTKEEKFNGNDFFKIDGYYCSKKMGKIENILKNFYIQRIEYKKNNDPREFAIKIIINSSYGILANSVFSSVYNPTAAADVTSLGRQCIKYAMKTFEENGFNVVYGDTDSCMVELGSKTREEAKEIASNITQNIVKNLPFEM